MPQKKSITTMKIRLHSYNSKEENITPPFEVTRIPEVGECFMMSNSGPCFKVLLVVHKPYPNSDSKAEVYAEEMELSKAKTEAGYKGIP